MMGLFILAISMARAGLEIWATENNESIVTNNSIEFTAKFNDGDTAPGTYKIPESGMLPNSIFYGIKKLRDFLWLNLSTGENKVKMAVLQSDKLISGANELIKKENYDGATEAGNEALDKLEYADKLLDGIKVANDQTKQLHYQIFWAGFAYEEIIKQEGGAFGIDNLKYSDLINRIDDWNKAQENNRYSWDI